MRKKKILITGDSLIRIEKITNVFEGQNHDIITSSDFSDIIKNISEHIIDLLIINVDMGVFNEIELVKKIRSDYMNDLMPIIILSSNADIGQKLDFLTLGVDDYLYYPFNEREMYLRTVNLLKRVDRNRDVNPLTGLSGNIEIQNHIVENIESGKEFAVLYCDLDNFKAYNDVYGFSSGDRVIKMVAEILNIVVNKVGNSDDFIGHIGGDDFVVMTVPERSDNIGNKIVEEFDKRILTFYNAEDREKGFIISKDRAGQVKNFPLMSISVAGVTTNTRRLICAPQVAEIAAEIKKYAKSIKGSIYVKDRRGNN
jgi:diguanylate cyclase (GGDEF)-like protein